MTETVGFIGLGTMGMPMVSNLSKAGVRLVVHDVNPGAAKTAGKMAGVTVAKGAADVAGESAVLFTCLPNDDIVRAAYLGAGGIASGGKAGLVTCDCSTVSPEATLEVSRALAAKSMTHMDTPMLGSEPQASRARSSSSWAATRPGSSGSRPTSRSWARCTCTWAPRPWATA